MKQIVLSLFLFLSSLGMAAFQEPVKKIYTITRCNPGAPEIDGKGKEPCWQQAEVGRDFWQNEPRSGEPATEPTEFRLLYDEKNLYALIRAHDSQPKKMISRLVRRDTEDESEEVGIAIDSYFDRRTAFIFSVTVAGVKKDQIMSNDGSNEDGSWDPVWDVKTAVDDSGWTAEMRIPFSQLRFGAAAEPVWGLDVYRELPRNQELSLWQHIPNDAAGVVHCFGELHGLVNLGQFSRIELLPYAVTDLATGKPEPDNPFAPGRTGHFKGGLDGKVGLSSNITMDFTVNPDFGQVEADPSEVNLTAFETFFEEKRPFFIEGKNIFDYVLFMGDGDLALDRLFYSRRIGRTPHYEVETSDGEYLRAPANTSILGAVKISGKTASGLSIGLLDAVTQQERAEIRSGTTERYQTTEPLSNYFTGRLQKDYNGGRSYIGMMLTGTHRKIEEAHLEFLNRAAYTGGLDFRHMSHDQNWIFDLRTACSHIRGDRAALLEIQTSSAHYFQRPDTDHLKVDSTATTLSGSGGALTFGKVGGGHWRFLSMTLWRSPGLELNDLGFMRQADQTIQLFWAAYRQLKPWHCIRESQINANQWNFWTFAGEHIGIGGNINGYLEFVNNWSLNGGVNRESEWVGISSLRGGPALLFPAGSNLWGEISTDSRKKAVFELEYSRYRNDHAETCSRHIELGMELRLLPALTISVAPSWNEQVSNLQYVETVETTAGPRYIMGRIDQKNLAAIMRLNYSITPELSVQYYGQPFIATGGYSQFKKITEPRAARYEERYHLFDAEEIGYDAEEEHYRVNEKAGGADEYRFDKPDFNFRQFRSNLVVRWEYRAGSTLYFVWSQGRTGVVDQGTFNYRHDTRALFAIYPENIFLVKCNYWFSL
jgi:hypothetical protein